MDELIGFFNNPATPRGRSFSDDRCVEPLRGSRFMVGPVLPGCAARPWALLLNPAGVGGQSAPDCEALLLNPAGVGGQSATDCEALLMLVHRVNGHVLKQP